jgi:hypothetical protein
VEVAVLLVVAVVILAVGIRVGMLLAPRVERLADGADQLDPTAEPTAATAAQPSDEDHDDRTA